MPSHHPHELVCASKHRWRSLSTCFDSQSFYKTFCRLSYFSMFTRPHPAERKCAIIKSAGGGFCVRGNVQAVSYLKLISRETACTDTHLCERKRLFNGRFILLLSVSFSDVRWGVIHLSKILTSPSFYYKWPSRRKVWKRRLFHFLPFHPFHLFRPCWRERETRVCVWNLLTLTEVASALRAWGVVDMTVIEPQESREWVLLSDVFAGSYLWLESYKYQD